MTLTGIRKAGFPSFVLFLFTLSDTYKRTIIKLMLPAKLANASDSKFFTAWRNNNKGFHAMDKPFGICFASHVGSLDLSDRRGGVLLSKPSLIAKSRCTQLLAGFQRSFLAKSSARFTESRGTHFVTGSLREYSTQARTSGRSNVKAAFTKGVEFVEPKLFTSGQKLRSQYQLENFKGKGIGTVLIKSALQIEIRMNAAHKSAMVFYPAPVQVDRATHIDFLIDRARDAVNSWGVGNIRRNHISKSPLLSHLISLVARMVRCSIFSSGLITPSLGNNLL